MRLHHPTSSTLASLLLACLACTPSDASDDAGEGTGTTGEDQTLAEGWSAIEVELVASGCTLDAGPASLAWAQLFPEGYAMGPLVDDGAGGVVIVGGADDEARVVDLDPDGSVRWARSYTTGEALDVDASPDGQIAIGGGSDGAGWVWTLSAGGWTRWGDDLGQTVRHVSVASDAVMVGDANDDLSRYAIDDGTLIYGQGGGSLEGLVDDTAGGFWVGEWVQIGFLGLVLELTHYDAAGEIVASLDDDLLELFAMAHDEQGRLVYLAELTDTSVRIRLGNADGNVGGQQSVPSDYGDPKTLAMGPGDDLLLGFSNQLIYYDTDANELWTGVLSCEGQPVTIDELAIDAERRSWIVGHLASREIVALVDPI